MQFALTINNGKLTPLLLASAVIASFATTTRTRGGLEAYDIDYAVESDVTQTRTDASAFQFQEYGGALWKQMDGSALKDAYYVPIQDNAPMQFWRGGGGGGGGWRGGGGGWRGGGGGGWRGGGRSSGGGGGWRFPGFGGKGVPQRVAVPVVVARGLALNPLHPTR